MTSYRPASVEQFVFNIGLSVCAGLLCACSWIVHLRFQSRQHSWLGFISLWAGMVAALGMIVTSSVPLQPDIMEVLALPREKRIMNTQSQLHSASANVFFIGALVHAICNTLKLVLDARSNNWVGTLGVSSLSLKLKCASIGFACCFIISPLLLTM